MNRPTVRIVQLGAATLARLADGDLEGANAGSPVELTASLALVQQYPFLETGEQWDDEDGLEIIFELPVDGPADPG